jgi:hypothetical protein
MTASALRKVGVCDLEARSVIHLGAEDLGDVGVIVSHDRGEYVSRFVGAREPPALASARSSHRVLDLKARPSDRRKAEGIAHSSNTGTLPSPRLRKLGVRSRARLARQIAGRAASAVVFSGGY